MSKRILSSAVSASSTPLLPEMNREEFLDLECEAGRPFLTEAQAQAYRLARIHRRAVESLLDDGDSETDGVR